VIPNRVEICEQDCEQVSAVSAMKRDGYSKSMVPRCGAGTFPYERAVPELNFLPV